MVGNGGMVNGGGKGGRLWVGKRGRDMAMGGKQVR